MQVLSPKLTQMASLAARYANPEFSVTQGGHVRTIAAGHYTVSGLSRHLRLGEFVAHRSRTGIHLGEVIRVEPDLAYVCPIEPGEPIGIHDVVIRKGAFRIAPDDSWCGRTINALGEPIDGGAPLSPGSVRRSISNSAPPSMTRSRVDKGFRTGVRAIDLFSPLCLGQRLGIFAGSGVGKSTLLNRLIGQKISIVSSKAQTTRHRVTGILTEAGAQFVFVDTPGFQTKHRNALNRAMNRSVSQALADVDLVFFVIEAGRFGEDDRKVLSVIPEAAKVILVINKVDQLKEKARLLPFIDEVRKVRDFAEIVPLSAEKGRNVEELVKAATPLLPLGEPMFEEDEITDRSERFLASEFLREKLFRLLGDELPYGIAVEIEKFEVEGNLRRIHAAVIVDKAGHKSIVIGKGGEKLKRISSEARVELEKLFDGKVFLEAWVKVKSGWADDERALKSLGYE